MPAWDSLSLIRTGEYICAKPSWPPAEHIVQPDQDGHTASGSGGWWSSRQAAIRRIAAARHDPQRSAPLLTDCVEEQQHRHSHRGRAAPGMDAFRPATTPRPSGFQRAICVSQRLIPARLSVLAMVASQGLSGWCGSCPVSPCPFRSFAGYVCTFPASCVNTSAGGRWTSFPSLRLVTPGLAEWQGAELPAPAALNGLLVTRSAPLPAGDSTTGVGSKSVAAVAQRQLPRAVVTVSG
jgi:hypothetical protein